MVRVLRDDPITSSPLTIDSVRDFRQQVWIVEGQKKGYVRPFTVTDSSFEPIRATLCASIVPWHSKPLLKTTSRAAGESKQFIAHHDSTVAIKTRSQSDHFPTVPMKGETPQSETATLEQLLAAISMNNGKVPDWKWRVNIWFLSIIVSITLSPPPSPSGKQYRYLNDCYHLFAKTTASTWFGTLSSLFAFTNCPMCGLSRSWICSPTSSRAAARKFRAAR